MGPFGESTDESGNGLLMPASNNSPSTVDVDQAVAEIVARRRQAPSQRSLLVGISGIDGCGKGYLISRIAAQLQRRGQNAVGINVDGWLNLPPKRFSLNNPAQHFYEHAIRFDDLFAQLILPLKAKRTHTLVADFAEETAREYRKHTYQFENVDIVVLEAIYLFKRAYREYFDLAFWIACTFETALERAIQRRQEGLLPDATIRAYETIYFPAQRIHFERDHPQTTVDFVIKNDLRLTEVSTALPALTGMSDADERR